MREMSSYRHLTHHASGAKRLTHHVSRLRRRPMTTANDEVQRVRSYLLAQANKLTIPELVEKVRNDSAAVWVAAAAVPADRLTERPGAEDWSAAEVLTH